ncbi:MAG: sigma 54-interacting transcriptional regulator [Desulfomonilaceae bacterium]
MNRQRWRSLKLNDNGAVNQMDTRASQLESKLLHDISRIIGKALDLDQTLEIILEILSERLSVKKATIALKNGEKNTLSIRASHGLGPERIRRGVCRLDEGVTGLIFRTAEPFVVPDISKEPLSLNKPGSRRIEQGQLSFVGVPIVLNGKAIGVMSIDRLFDEDVPFEEDVRFLTLLSAIVAQLVSLNGQVKTREQNLIKANFSLKTELSAKSRNFFAVGTSPTMLEVQRLIRKVAPTEACVLLLGESGTGKTLVAKIIHELSSRAWSSFIKVNCTALPGNLLESELFGYEKGTFPGAVESKAGRVEEADGGTIFLGEIGELPMPLQVKLLRFLQDREFEPLGSTKTGKVDVRIIAATNRDLSAAVADGSFREDLYYRLHVFPIRVPPLRERREDIIPLVGFFCDKISHEYGSSLQFTNSALDAFVKYSWPGNVREMENLVERLAIVFDQGTIDLLHLSPYLVNGVKDLETPDRKLLDSPRKYSWPGNVREMENFLERLATIFDQGTIDLSHLSPHLAHGVKDVETPDRKLLDSLRARERQEVLDALERNNWIQSQAAQELGITLRQMGYRVKKFGLGGFTRKKKAAG